MIFDLTDEEKEALLLLREGPKSVTNERGVVEAVCVDDVYRLTTYDLAEVKCEEGMAVAHITPSGVAALKGLPYNKGH